MFQNRAVICMLNLILCFMPTIFYILEFLVQIFEIISQINQISNLWNHSHNMGIDFAAADKTMAVVSSCFFYPRPEIFFVKWACKISYFLFEHMIHLFVPIHAFGGLVVWLVQGLVV